jgi:hypothetical protein
MFLGSTERPVRRADNLYLFKLPRLVRWTRVSTSLTVLWFQQSQTKPASLRLLPVRSDWEIRRYLHDIVFRNSKPGAILCSLCAAMNIFETHCAKSVTAWLNRDVIENSACNLRTFTWELCKCDAPIFTNSSTKMQNAKEHAHYVWYAVICSSETSLTISKTTRCHGP